MIRKSIILSLVVTLISSTMVTPSCYARNGSRSNASKASKASKTHMRNDTTYKNKSIRKHDESENKPAPRTAESLPIQEIQTTSQGRRSGVFDNTLGNPLFIPMMMWGQSMYNNKAEKEISVKEEEFPQCKIKNEVNDVWR